MRLADAPLLGAGRGTLARAHPPVRIVAGALLVAAALIAPGGVAGAAALAGFVAVALALALPPAAWVARAIAVGLVLYLPLVAFLALPRFVAGDASEAAVLVAGIAGRGVAVLLVTVAVASSLAPVDLHRGIAGLPLPRTPRLLLLSMTHGTGVLARETGRMRAAVALRAPAGRAGVRVLAGLPQAWLVRVADRAKRTADAMELRGFAALPMPGFPRLASWAVVDAAVAGAAVAAVLGAAALRWIP